jgi:hypothetical protein
MLVLTNNIIFIKLIKKQGGYYMEKVKPRKTGMARLWELAFTKKSLVIASCVLSQGSGREY